MPFDRAFRLSSLLLAASAFGGLVLAQAVPVWLAALTATILSLSVLATLEISLLAEIPARITVPTRLWNVLLVGAFLFFLVDLAAISGDLLPAGVHFLTMLLTLKLLTLHQRVDYRHLFAISLMAILASAALTTEIWYVPIFMLYLLTAVWTLLLYHLCDVDQGASAPADSSPRQLAHEDHPRRIRARFFLLTNGIAVLAFGLTVAIFFLLPRIGAGMWQKTRGGALRTTGFSERVDLGTIGAIKQDPQLVMRVELQDSQQARRDRLYLRGVAYDRYNGRSWNTGNPRRRNLGSTEDGTFSLIPVGSRLSEILSGPIVQDILLESLDTAVLFSVPLAVTVAGEFPGLQTDSMGGIFLPFVSSARTRYSVTSREPLLLPVEQTAQGMDYPRGIQDRYLQLPELSSQVADLSHAVTRDAATPYERVLAVHQHLLQSYQYSLDVETASSAHPLEDFLFTRKTGYCEHYATAMVVMLRTIGIPARLVTGFLATEWNEFGGYFTVRQRDAHAWVEVFFPRSGWITFDPTPATGAVALRSRWEALSRFSESLRLHWDRVFIRYSVRDQFAMVQGVREGGDAARDWVRHWVTKLSMPVASMLQTWTGNVRGMTLGYLQLSIGLTVFGMAFVVLLVRDRIGLWMATHLPSSRKHPAIVQLYQRMLRVLEGRGVRKPPSTTPREFVREVERGWQAAGPLVSDITACYCRGRFGERRLSSEELAHVTEQITRLRQLTRTGK